MTLGDTSTWLTTYTCSRWAARPRQCLAPRGRGYKELLASLKELGFECRLHIVHDPKLGVNIYHCKNSS
jgi:hypothetical protein